MGRRILEGRVCRYLWPIFTKICPWKWENNWLAHIFPSPRKENLMACAVTISFFVCKHFKQTKNWSNWKKWPNNRLARQPYLGGGIPPSGKSWIHYHHCTSMVIMPSCWIRHEWRTHFPRLRKCCPGNEPCAIKIRAKTRTGGSSVQVRIRNNKLRRPLPVSIVSSVP